jgi:hypothetical protein
LLKEKLHLAEPNLANAFLHKEKLASYADHGQQFPKNTPFNPSQKIAGSASELELNNKGYGLEGERDRPKNEGVSSAFREGRGQQCFLLFSSLGRFIKNG